MTVRTQTVGADDIREALDHVPDPELPAVSVAELGMVADVRVEQMDGGHRAEVDLIPTFSGCPATTMIERDVRDALAALDGVDDVVVRFVHDPVWTPERISAPGRRKLAEFGIAPPGSGQVLVHIGSRPSRAAAQQGVRCPLCGSRDTVADAPFGPTPCRSTSYCNACRNPFEVMKP